MKEFVLKITLINGDCPTVDVSSEDIKKVLEILETKNTIVFGHTLFRVNNIIRLELFGKDGKNVYFQNFYTK